MEYLAQDMFSNQSISSSCRYLNLADLVTAHSFVVVMAVRIPETPHNLAKIAEETGVGVVGTF